MKAPFAWRTPGLVVDSVPNCAKHLHFFKACWSDPLIRFRRSHPKQECHWSSSTLGRSFGPAFPCTRRPARPKNCLSVAFHSFPGNAFLILRHVRMDKPSSLLDKRAGRDPGHVQGGSASLLILLKRLNPKAEALAAPRTLSCPAWRLGWKYCSTRALRRWLRLTTTSLWPR